ncbi:peptidoglycan-binding LysM [Melioribacter roseus P3M-2]|uniref:Peptidoglycan-binding LysM n=1 Tax=Melioribacter roseus (strain DSM 23840 / JCM 17771 / VKM B-2668 / P3M-2) TaxID=1191523 RepID=I6Z8S4_MELRP|nr:discoidin domain-containing protein [Melioribacter roseus]AFN75555.1 peptidoglycan-binding LysM [Melioribacter roseus P3M-2]
MKKFVSILLTLFFTAVNLSFVEAQTWQSKILYYNDSGKLVYVSDDEGNKIPDFSYAGYRNGEVDIPYIPVVKTISPIEGDNTRNIQNAIDEAGKLPINENGFRGAVLLSAGTYEIYGTIKINYDGVILRGVGDGADPSNNTILIGKGDKPHQRTIIVAGGGNITKWQEQAPGTKTNIKDSILYIGANMFTVENPEYFNVGDNIIIFHPVTDKWIAAVGGGGTDTDREWQVSDGINIVYNRFIKNIKDDTIFIDAPIYNTLDKSLSQSYIYKYARTGLKKNIGIENLRIDIEANGITTDSNGDENHAWQAIDLIQIEDAWVKNCTLLHFGQSGVRTSTATRITIDSCKALEPVSNITGERRYNFNLYHASQLILVKNCLTTYARHSYISNGTSTVSGCVFYNNRSENDFASSEGHRMWSQALLYDNIIYTKPNTTILIGLYSRGNYGTSHGWGAVHSVAWNCTVPSNNKIIIQKPPTAQNYAIGCKGIVTGLKYEGAPFDYPQGYIEGTNKIGLYPASLYEAQLQERLGIGKLPSAPSNLVATALSSNKILLEWIDNSKNEMSYSIERSVDEGNTWTIIASVGANVTKFLDTSVIPATSYLYKIKAANSMGSSEYSNIASVTTPNALPINAPSNITVTDITYDKIILKWSDNSNNEDFFYIERKSENDTVWIVIGIVNMNITEFQDSSFLESTKYYYRLQAKNAYGSSDYSNIVSITTLSRGGSENLALNRPVKFSSQQIEPGNENLAIYAVDGDLNTRWSSERGATWPQWIEVDLGELKTFNKTELICFNDRAYQYTIEARSDTNDSYIEIVDRTNNTTPGTKENPIIDVFNSVKARYVKLTVTGAYNYPGPWTSILEFRIYYDSNLVSVAKNIDKPIGFVLYQNTPNPFNPTTNIKFTIPNDGTVTFKIYDILGNEITTLIDNKYYSMGDYNILFNGASYSSGVYIYQLIYNNNIYVKKMMLLK